MEIPTAETIGKWTGGFLVGITAVWKIVEKVFKREPEEEVEESAARHLRRAEDSGLKIAVEEMERRINRIEERFDKRFADERQFFLQQLQGSEERITSQVESISRRIDDHYQGVNERLDILIKGNIK